MEIMWSGLYGGGLYGGTLTTYDSTAIFFQNADSTVELLKDNHSYSGPSL